jgi:acyl-CoA thioesterase-2
MSSRGPDQSRLGELLRVRPLGGDAFEATLEGFEGRSFGGQTLGCAALAAAHTCEGRALHSLHAWFLRPVPAEAPIAFDVERTRDGRRFAHRRVRVRAGERLLCELAASFTAPGDGPDFQDAAPDPAAPPPEQLPSDEEVARAEGWEQRWAGPFELRWVGTPWRAQGEAADSRYLTWVRPRQPLPADPAVHAAAIAYLSDFHSHWPVARKLGGPFEPVGFVSLDQILWLHRDLPCRDWRLLASECDVAHGGRALTRRSLHERDGRLVASMAQEALIPGRPGA